MDFKNKKLLILGGAYQHIKIVKAAKELGIKTYVTDFLPIEKSPAKQIADVPLMYNITDIDNLIEFCKQEHIDGVIGPYLDVTQIPCLKICEKLGLPCFGTPDQHDILTNKLRFKEFCKEHGADIIESYTPEDVLNHPEKVNFPILVKPSDSRGSRGQTICYNKQDVAYAIEQAKTFSNSGGIIIEKYMSKSDDIQLVYMVINKKPVLVRVEDRYTGSHDGHFNKLCIATIDPSKNDVKYRRNCDEKVKSMIKSIGLTNSPVFIQAFIDGDTARLYDPGIRFPGDDFDDLYKVITGIDIPKMLVEFSLTGNFSEDFAEKIKNARLNKPAAMILPCLKPGKIKKILGYNELKQNKKVISCSKSYDAGDEVLETRDVRQRFGEFCIVCENMQDLKNTIDEIFNKLEVLDETGQNMLIEKFNTNTLKEYES